MRYLVSVLAYGDCLITLSLMEQLDLDPSEYRILGTAITSRVSGLLHKPLPVVELLQDRAAFYALKEYGARKACADFISLRQSLKRQSRPGDVLAFERNDIRTLAVKPLRIRGMYPAQTHCAYRDRQELVGQLFGRTAEWVPVCRPRVKVRSVLINPCARFGNRWLAPRIIENIIAIAAQQGWSLTLLDPCKRYAAYKNKLTHYDDQSSLADAAEMLKASDLYIGPDSFFIHLAYYHRIPLFGFFLSHYHDFLAPGMVQLGNFMDFEAALDRECLENKLIAFSEPVAQA